MGLILEDKRFAVLSDILGDEDHLGDMDFKVAGTEEGVTSLQMDIKIAGITEEIMKVALAQAKDGRLHILGEMAKALTSARAELGEHAPRIEMFKIPTDKIREVIGTGGKVIREIVEKTGAKINIEDDGSVKVASADGESIKAAINWIKSIASDPEPGTIYEGTVVKVMDFGAFVNFFGAKDGLVHISQLAPHRVNKVTDVVKEGDKVKVKLLGMDERGKVRLSMKAVDQATGEDLEAKQKARRPAAGRRRRRGGVTRFATAACAETPARRFAACFPIEMAATCPCSFDKRERERAAFAAALFISALSPPPSACADDLCPAPRNPFGAARCAAKPSRSCGRLRLGEAQQLHARVARFGIDRDLRQQRHAVAVRHHLHHGGKRGGAEPRRPSRARAPAQNASAWSRRQWPSSSRISRRWSTSATLTRARAGSASAAGTASRNASSNSASVSTSAPSTGSASITASSSPRLSSSSSSLVCVSRTSSRSLRIFRLQPRQHARQNVGRQRRDDAELEPPAEQVAVAGEIDQIAGGGEDLLGALGHVQADIGERDVARPPLDQFGADLALQLAHLHGQRRLGHRAVVRRPPEMPMARERGEITQLSQGDHGDKIYLSILPINTIRPDGSSHA